MIKHNVIGPYDSVGDGALIKDSRMNNSILVQESQLLHSNLAGTLIGSGSEVTGTPSRLNVVDSSDIHPKAAMANAVSTQSNVGTFSKIHDVNTADLTPRFTGNKKHNRDQYLEHGSIDNHIHSQTQARLPPCRVKPPQHAV